MSSSYYLPVMFINTSVNTSDQDSPPNTFNPKFIPGSDQHYALSHPAQLFCLSLSQQENTPPLICASAPSPQTFPRENYSEIDWAVPQPSTLFLIPIGTLTNVIPSPCAEVSETPSAPQLEEQPKPRFKGEKQVSKHGKHDVLVYPIPESSLAYVFSLRRKNDGYSIYCCDLCKRKDTYLSIKVIEDQFLSDPCKLEHVCIPVIRAHDMVERIFMKASSYRSNNRENNFPKQWMEEIRMQILENEEIGDVGNESSPKQLKSSDMQKYEVDFPDGSVRSFVSI
ncbi:hypothetical protein Aduo_019674 [Ancylostoma duodenale]